MEVHPNQTKRLLWDTRYGLGRSQSHCNVSLMMTLYPPSTPSMVSFEMYLALQARQLTLFPPKETEFLVQVYLERNIYPRQSSFFLSRILGLGCLIPRDAKFPVTLDVAQ